MKTVSALLVLACIAFAASKENDVAKDLNSVRDGGELNTVADNWEIAAVNDAEDKSRDPFWGRWRHARRRHTRRRHARRWHTRRRHARRWHTRRRHARRWHTRRRHARRWHTRRRHARRWHTRRRHARRWHTRRRHARRWHRRRSYTRRWHRRRRRARRRISRRRIARRRIARRRIARRRTGNKKRVTLKHDRCGRICNVVQGRLVNCFRLRKDFESMKQEEQNRFIKAYYTITSKSPYKARYAKLIQMHENNFATRIHQKTEFFPWHRWFLLQIENMLQEIDCRVTVPYWDWSIWAHDPWDNKKMWSANHGLGGNGRKSDQCVTTGLFRVGNWKTSRGGCLRRGFNGAPADAAQVAIALKEKTFEKFELMTRVNLHEAVHCLINGTMCSARSAEAPEFFFHHGFIDKIWADYQMKSAAHKNAYYPTIKQKMVAINYYPKDFIDLSKQPGGVRVMYMDPTIHHAAKIRKYLAKLSLYKVEHLRRLSFSWTSERSKTLFHLSSLERAKAKLLEKESRANVAKKRQGSIFEKTLSSLERVEGFKISPKS